MTVNEMLTCARRCASAVARADTELKNKALLAMADALLLEEGPVLEANRIDLEAAKGKVSEVMMDRLALNSRRIGDMADGIRQVAALPDPVREVLAETKRPNGLLIRRVAVPMGVIAVIYESRPNVTSDAAALTLKAGSACVLRCGKEAHRSCTAIINALKNGLISVGLPGGALQLLEDISRDSARRLMTATKYVDLLIPRGGGGLIRSCTENATVPVLQTGTGVCHIYVDKDADFDMALNIVENAKCSRPSVCNACEVCLVHKDIASVFLPLLYKRLTKDREAAGLTSVELRLDSRAAAIIPGTPAKGDDFSVEYLDYVLAVGVTDDLCAAMAHIDAHSTGHSDCIITENPEAARTFRRDVDSAAVYWNASTRFTDGGEFGLGCEIGISTQKLHARGPLGLRELCTSRYLITGNGQIR